MGFFRELIQKWKQNAEEKRKRDEKNRIELRNFYRECVQQFPKGTQISPEQFLRFAWKRACVLQKYYKSCGNEVEAKHYGLIFGLICVEHNCSDYWRRPLKISKTEEKELLKAELSRIFPQNAKTSSRNTKLACVYLGRDTNSGRIYIGQTLVNQK